MPGLTFHQRSKSAPVTRPLSQLPRKGLTTPMLVMGNGAATSGLASPLTTRQEDPFNMLSFFPSRPGAGEDEERWGWLCEEEEEEEGEDPEEMMVESFFGGGISTEPDDLQSEWSYDHDSPVTPGTETPFDDVLAAEVIGEEDRLGLVAFATNVKKVSSLFASSGTGLIAHPPTAAPTYGTEFEPEDTDALYLSLRSRRRALHSFSSAEELRTLESSTLPGELFSPVEDTPRGASFFDSVFTELKSVPPVKVDAASPTSWSTWLVPSFLRPYMTVNVGSQ